MKNLYIVHDNGIKGQVGCTDYTMEEINAKGGVNAILDEFRSVGITIIDWYIS